MINNSLTDTTKVELPKAATVYALAGKDGIRSKVMTLNGRNLVLDENDELPNLQGETVAARRSGSRPRQLHVRCAFG